MAQYLLSTYSVEGEDRPPVSEAQTQQLMSRVHRLEEEMNADGALLFSGRLHRSDTATVVRSSGGDVVTTDGPFAESKEHLGGFYIVRADDLDAALGWAAKTSEAIGRGIEVRPFWEPPGA